MPGDHPEDSIPDCVEDLKNQGHDEDSAHAICTASIEGKSFDETDLPQILKQSGAEEWVDTVAKLVNSNVESSVIGEVVQRARSGQSRESAQKAISKSSKIEKVGFEAEMHSQFTVFKADDDDFVIWGPGSVEIVDKEGDKIQAKALQKALPQLLKRARLSLEHSDQLVGRILERFETEDPVTIEIDGKTFKQSEFPTDVLELDGMEPALYVAGEIWDDSRQAQETRKRIENGELTSYSISGEALVTRKKVTSEGDTYDDIVDIDLSAVTICEEGMNQKAKFAQVTEDGEKVKATAEKSDDPVSPDSGQGEAPTVSAVASIAKEAISETMTETDEKSGDNPEGGFSLEALQTEFKSVLDEKLPDGELATKDDTLTREDVESIANEVYSKQEDVAGEEDQQDSGTSEAAGRPGEEADVSGEEANIGPQAEPHDESQKNDSEAAKEEDEAGADDAEDSGYSDSAGRPGDETDYPDTQGDAPDSEGDDVDKQGLSQLAAEMGVEEKTLVELKQLFAGKGDEEDEFFTDEEYDEEYEEEGYDEEVVEPEEEEADATGRDYVESDPEEEEVVEEPEDDYEVEPDEERPDEEEEADVVEAEGYSSEELEDQLPADVWEVVREYLDENGAGAEGAPGEEEAPGDEMMASASSDDIESAVEKILSGSGLAKAGGADAPSSDVEKSYDDEEPQAKHGDNPALANFYN